ncbi:hypothetical protein [Glycomyces harbinensis]|uniref:hypothetical protein n=1 Tax=Glycomyces harbinensis TaxID=58114 RepID=UPI001FDF5AFE|nr:hypothetical protein [Glycomyces harbinensis]
MEIETACCELKSSLLDRWVLRARDPTGLTQEVWALLALCQALRCCIDDAVLGEAISPLQASFTLARETSRNQVIAAQNLFDIEKPTSRPTGVTRSFSALASFLQQAMSNSSAIYSSATVYLLTSLGNSIGMKSMVFNIGCPGDGFADGELWPSHTVYRNRFPRRSPVSS